MFVEYWPVGTNLPQTLPLTVGHISGHVSADWIPSLPPDVGTAFTGWPPFLIETTWLGPYQGLALRKECRLCERQWKSTLSWMLGVAGTRHVLQQEGYRWIAPLSAFYPEATQPVNVASWNPSFLPRSVTAHVPEGSRTRLRPDYLVMRSTAGQTSEVEWAVAESKGTRYPLTSMRTCRTEWSNQARNVEVRVNEVPIAIPRFLVVATRVNPNAERPRTRRLQVRAWNNREGRGEKVLPPVGAVEIAAAHIFGLFRNLHLRENALSIALSVQARAEGRHPHGSGSIRQQLLNASERADTELHERTEGREEGSAAVVRFETAVGTIRFNIAEAIVFFARKFSLAGNAEEAFGVLKEVDSQLDHWENFRRKTTTARRIVFPFGLEMEVPERFEER